MSELPHAFVPGMQLTDPMVRELNQRIFRLGELYRATEDLQRIGEMYVHIDLVQQYLAEWVRVPK